MTQNAVSQIEKNLHAMGINLQEARIPVGNFLASFIDQDALYISGQVSVDGNGQLIKGKLGENMDTAAGQTAAKYCAIGVLAQAKQALGDLGRIKKLVKLGIFVNAAEDFSEHPQVANGASDFMVDVLGQEKGAHVRFAVGASSLPSGAAVEVEALLTIGKTSVV